MISHQSTTNQLPFLQFGNNTKNAIQEIATLLNRAAPAAPPLRTPRSVKPLPPTKFLAVAPRVPPLKPIQLLLKDILSLQRVAVPPSPPVRPVQFAQHSTMQQINHIYHPETGTKQTYDRL